MNCRLTILACSAILALASATASPAADETPLWPQIPTRIDRNSQHFERLPAVTSAIDTRAWLPVPSRIRIIDGTSFIFDGNTYKLANLHGLEIDRICGDGQGGRWSCGRAASVALNNLVRGKRLLCDIEPRGKVTMLGRCLSGNRDVSSEIVGLGLARPTGAAELLEIETLARKRGAGLWQNPDCIDAFDRC